VHAAYQHLWRSRHLLHKVGGPYYSKRNSLRNLIDSIGSDGQLSPVLEKKGILGHTVGRRPGDVTFERWTESKGLAIDVAVTSALAPTYVRMSEPCEWYAANRKHRKYDVSFEGTDYLFSPVVFETLGAINTEGEQVLKQLFRFAAKRLEGVHIVLWTSLGSVFLQFTEISGAGNSQQN